MLVFWKIFEFYQAKVIGIEYILRSHTIGLIGASGEYSETITFLNRISLYTLGVLEILFGIHLYRYLHFYYQNKNQIPPIYQNFLPKNKTLMRDLIIPLGLFNGCILSLSLIIIHFKLSYNELEIFIGLGFLPLIIIIIITLIVLNERDKNITIKYLLSMGIFFIFQF